MPSKKLITGIALIAALSMPAIASAQTLDEYASSLVGHTVTVNCFQPNGIEGGYVWLEHPETVYLDGQYCGVISNALANSNKTKRYLASDVGAWKLGSAVLTLTHEAMHLKLNSGDEGHVECVAVRNVWQSIKQLPTPSKLLKNVYNWATSTHQCIQEPEYRTEC